MKKIDYQHLAQTINANFEKVNNEKNTPEFSDGWKKATIQIAVIFSDHAHVDKEKFLTACGIVSK